MTTFASPAYLWLLAIPGVLLVLWVYAAIRRAIDVTRIAADRVSPIATRWSLVGDLGQWLCIILAGAALLVALARPRAVAPGFARAGLDVVVLQDGSASMTVADVPGGSRWARSMQFLRRLGDALRWQDDRVAMTVFARMSTPEIRLTHDPTTVFFFLDHLAHAPPFALTDEAAWDTNVEQAITWGLRVLKKDHDIVGPSKNAPVFLLISDGETWSGEVARAIEQMHLARVPLYVVGVGTLGGGRMPVLPFPDEGDPPPKFSHLDRHGLQRLAAEGGGSYFELDREFDRDIANNIIDSARRAAPPRADRDVVTELYWPVLAAACGLAAAGALLARRRAVVGLELAGAAAALAVAIRVLW